MNGELFSEDSILLSEFKDKYEDTRKEQFNSGVCYHVGEINYKECLCLATNKKNILLLGDSHAGQFSLSFRTKLDTTQYNFMEHTVVGSFPLIDSKGEKNPRPNSEVCFIDFLQIIKEKLMWLYCPVIGPTIQVQQDMLLMKNWLQE